MAPTQDKFWIPVQLFYDFADKVHLDLSDKQSGFKILSDY